MRKTKKEIQMEKFEAEVDAFKDKNLEDLLVDQLRDLVIYRSWCDGMDFEIALQFRKSPLLARYVYVKELVRVWGYKNNITNFLGLPIHESDEILHWQDKVEDAIKLREAWDKIPKDLWPYVRVLMEKV